MVTHTQIQLHLTFPKTQPTADEALRDTRMSAHMCLHWHAGHLNTEIRPFTFLIGSLNNSGEECCKTHAAKTYSKGCFRAKKKTSPENSRVLYTKQFDALNDLLDITALVQNCRAPNSQTSSNIPLINTASPPRIWYSENPKPNAIYLPIK